MAVGKVDQKKKVIPPKEDLISTEHMMKWNWYYTQYIYLCPKQNSKV